MPLFLIGEKVKNIVLGIFAHVDAGKTTLSEAILYKSGVLRKPGRVDHGDAFLDTDPMEKDRGITIFSKQAVFTLEDKRIFLLDTPGHVDFCAETERTMQVLDYAVLVISGTDGVQGHTRTLWNLLEEYKVPVFLFMNKMDQPGADRTRLMRELQKKLDEGCIDFSVDNEECMEEIAMTDEDALDSYMEEEKVEPAKIQKLIRERKVFPCFFGSALKMQGVEELLYGFRRYMIPFFGQKEFGARIFKISRDDKGERLTFLKVTGGHLEVKMPVTDAEKINQIRIYSGAKYQMVKEAGPGSICAVTGLSSSYVGQGIGAEREDHTSCLEPVLAYQVILPEGTDASKMFRELKQLEEEEPLLNITWNAALGEIHMKLMGEVQTEILQSMIAERFHIPITFGPGKIAYKETIQEPVIGVGHYEPLRHYAEVHLYMEPLPPGSGLVFDTVCSEDVLDRNWQRLILTHLKEKEHVGVLTGSPITDMKITLTAGRAHLKHTEGGDFREATYRAVRQGLKSAKNVLLEPWYSFVMEIPTDQVGRVMADIGQKCGSFQGPGTPDEQGMVRISGMAPVSEMQDYQKELLSYTKGKGRISYTVKGYAPCHNAADVIARMEYDSERDLDNPTGSVFCSHGAGFPVSWNEVPKYMHIKEERREEDGNEQDKEEKSGQNLSRKFYSSYEEDPELLAIMEREFGGRHKDKDRYSGYRQENTPASDRRESTLNFDRPRKKYLLVDGYNIIFAWEELQELAKASIDAARSKLMDILCNYQGFTGDTLILVFDAYKVKGNMGEVQKYHNIYVVYTKEAETADQYIEKTTHEIGRKYEVTVATSDALEQVIVMGQGAYRISARDFYKEVERVEEKIREMNEKEQGKGKNYLLDYANEEETAHLQDVRMGKTKFGEKI